MEFEKISIAQKIGEWINGCPFVSEIHPTETMLVYGGANEGNVLPEPLVHKDMLGNVAVQKQVNLRIIMKTETLLNHDFATEYLFNLENWIEQQSLSGLAPIIGDEPDNEHIWADSSRYTPSGASETGEFSVPIHIQFKKYY